MRVVNCDRQPPISDLGPAGPCWPAGPCAALRCCCVEQGESHSWLGTCIRSQQPPRPRRSRPRPDASREQPRMRLLVALIATHRLAHAAPLGDSDPRAATSSEGCPPVATQGNFNLTEWIRASWYIQQQQITGYQSPEDLFCVVATYELEGREVPGFDGTVVSVYNYQNRGAVNGPGTDPEQDPLCARLTDEDEPSKIINAPCFLPNLLAGPYWVVAAGPSPQRYSWGIVSGGQPDVPAPDGSGCSNTEEGVNGSGFWLFSRSPTLSAQDLEDIRTVARMNGFALDRLRPGEYA